MQLRDISIGSQNVTRDFWVRVLIGTQRCIVLVTYITTYEQLYTALHVSCSTFVDIVTVIRSSACLATLTSMNPSDPFHSSTLVMYTSYSYLYTCCNYNQYLLSYFKEPSSFFLSRVPWHWGQRSPLTIELWLQSYTVYSTFLVQYSVQHFSPHRFIYVYVSDLTVLTTSLCYTSLRV